MLNCLSFFGLSASYIVVSYWLMPIIEPYIIDGWLGYVQLYTIGFCIGFGGTAFLFYIKEKILIIYKNERSITNHIRTWFFTS